MPAKFEEAPAVEKIAQKLIHTDHPHLSEVPIKYVFRDQASVPVGKIIWGKTHLFQGLRATVAIPDEQELKEHLETQGAPAFFVIEVHEPSFNALPENGKNALVDELLCQCWAEDETTKSGTFRKLSLLPYDMQGFARNIDKFGLWKKDLELMARGMAKHLQPELNMGPVTTAKAVSDRREHAKAKETAAKPKSKQKGTPGNSREETGEELLTIGGRDYKASIYDDRGAESPTFMLNINQIDGEGQVLQCEADDMPFDSKEAAWAFVDEWAAAKRAEGSNGSTPLKVQEGGKKAAAGARS